MADAGTPYADALHLAGTPQLPKLNSTRRQGIQDACGGTVLVPLYQHGKLHKRIVAMLTPPDQTCA